MKGGYMVEVNNVSNRATICDVENFFAFSGRIINVDLRRDGVCSQVAYVTFKDPESIDTAILLSGCSIVDQPVSILPMDDTDQEEVWEHEAVNPMFDEQTSVSTPRQLANRAHEMAKTMLSRGHVLGKEMLARAKEASFNDRMSIRERWEAGTDPKTANVNDYRIGERTKLAFEGAQKGIKTAGSFIANSKYAATGGLWINNAFDSVAKVASDMTLKAKERVHKTQQELKAQG